jgi:hypothetical protein
MDRLRIEEQLALFGIVTIRTPSDKELKELRKSFDVTELGNGQIQIMYK